MLLVSHSMQQVLELCDEAIWLDQGSVRMRGEAFLVVKAYEQHLFGPISELAAADAPTAQAGEDPDSESAGPSRSSRPDAAIPMSEGRTGGVTPRSESSFQIQEPRFRPHAVEQSWSPPVPTAFTCIAPGGLSRWDGECGLKIIGFGVYAESGPTDRLVSMQPVKFVFTLESDRESDFECRYGIAIHDHLGACRTRIFSPCDAFSAVRGGLRSVVIVLNPCQLGPGEYTLGISVSRYAVLERINSAPRYDLLSRSFCFRVELPESLAALDSAFVHSAEWSFEAADA